MIFSVVIDYPQSAIIYDARQTKRTRPGGAWSGLVKGGARSLVGSAFGVNSGQFSLQSGLDLAPVYSGPGRASRVGPVQEQLANITEPASGGLELVVI